MKSEEDHHQASPKPSLANIAQLTQKLFSNIALIGLLEFRQIILSIIFIFFAVVSLLFLICAIWILVQFMLYSKLTSLGINHYHILGIIISLQVFLMIPILIFIKLRAKKFLFPATRKALTLLEK